VAGVEGVTGAAANDGELEILVADAHHRLPRLIDAVVGSGAIVRGVDLVSPDLEAVFLHLTGRALRDAD
jgi:ABC-2 type transport system ATP-binding protein